MRRPLVIHATDLQPASEPAFHHALKIALAGRARLRLVHVHAPDRQVAPLAAFPHVRETLNAWGLLPAGAASATIEETLRLSVSKAEVAAGRPGEALGELAAHEEAALVVVGTRGLDGLDQLWRRSFAETLARHAQTPTLFVPSGARGFVDARSGAPRLDTVLIPVAAAPSASPAIKATFRLIDALSTGANVRLLHVGAGGSMPSHPAAKGRPLETVTKSGPLVETIVSVADEIDADLIAMTTAGHDSLLDSLRGSTTEQVLRRAHRPLLAVPVA